MHNDTWKQLNNSSYIPWTYIGLLAAFREVKVASCTLVLVPFHQFVHRIIIVIDIAIVSLVKNYPIY